MYSLKIICGTCDQPATMHPVLPDSGDFVIPCPREADQIGNSLWYDSSPAYFTNVTQYTEDPAYIEALKQLDLGVSKKVAIPKGNVHREVNDYVVMDGITTLAYNHSGTEAQSGSDLMTHRIAEDYDLFGLGADDNSAYVPQDSPTSEQSKLDRWNDATHTVYGNTKSWTCTSVLGEDTGEYVLSQTVDAVTGAKSRSKTFVSDSESIDKTQRNAYVEGNEGFISLSLLDEQLTRKYHEKLLNVFLDKQTGDVRVGSIRLIKNTDGTLTARCVNRDCGPNGRRASMTIAPDKATRTDMEDFVWAMVAHGNNHAASWFRTRDTFHKVHRLGCDINRCNPEAVNCPATTSVHTEELNEVEFLMEHQQYCNNSNCKCSDRLEELVGDLNVNAHIYQSAS